MLMKLTKGGNAVWNELLIIINKLQNKLQKMAPDDRFDIKMVTVLTFITDSLF